MSTNYLYKQESPLGHLTLLRIQYVFKMKKKEISKYYFAYSKGLQFPHS